MCSTIDVMRQRWFLFWNRVEVSGCSNTIIIDSFDAVLAKYSESHRAYHHLGHIRECLSKFDNVKWSARMPDFVEAAIWFHDVVYDTKAKDNEAQSVVFARNMMDTFELPPLFKDYVSALILATTHQGGLTHPDDQLIADIDLSGFGKTYDQVAEDCRKIRREYDWVPEAEFIAGRGKILQMFLDREPLFYTDRFKRDYEEEAKKNLRRQIADLPRLSVLAA